VIGAFDHGIYGAVERVSDHLPLPPPGKPRQVLWRIYAARAILAGGATERPIAFENNDRPDIMLAGALRAYANRWGVKVGHRVAVFTNNDDGLRTAADLTAKGVEVVAVIDSRAGEAVIDTRGRLGLTSAHPRPRGPHAPRGRRCSGRVGRLEPERQSTRTTARGLSTTRPLRPSCRAAGGLRVCRWRGRQQGFFPPSARCARAAMPPSPR
jgi:hypothetical protein